MNPRKHFDEKGIEELADSIFNNGMIQPITVRPHPSLDKEYEIVCGERRYRAKVKILDRAQQADLINCIIKEMTDEVAMDMIIAENLQREDISPMEEAAGFLTLMKVRHIDAKEIAAKVGKSPGYVAQRLKLNDLNNDWQKFLHEGHLSIKDALTVSSLPDQAQVDMFKNEVNGSHWVKGEMYEIGEYNLRKYQSRLENPPFDPDNPTLIKGVGACSGCKFNSAFDGLLFPELANDPVCRNPACFQNKCDASFNSRLTIALEDPGIVFITGEYSPSKQTSALMKTIGSGVLTYYDYSTIEAPDPPDFKFFQGDNDTHEEDVEDFERAKSQYQQELEIFNRSMRSGKLQKAFVLGGDDKGREVYVKVNNKKGQETAKKKQSAAETVTTTPEDIKHEIQKVKDREKRAIELDDAKVWDEVQKMIKPAINIKDITGNLSQVERIATAAAIFDKLSHPRQAEFRKAFSLKANNTRFGTGIVLPDDIDTTLLTQMLRFFFLDVLPPFRIDGSFKNNHKASIALMLAESYWPGPCKSICDKQQEVADRRAKRVKDRIAVLQDELKALKSPATTAKAASPDASKQPTAKKSTAKKKSA